MFLTLSKPINIIESNDVMELLSSKKVSSKKQIMELLYRPNHIIYKSIILSYHNCRCYITQCFQFVIKHNLDTLSAHCG